MNARIRSLNERFGIDRPSYEVLCECGQDSCVQRIEVPVAVFAEVHADARTFIVAPGHRSSEPEHVVAEASGYWIVDAAVERSALAPRLLPVASTT